MGDNKDGKVKEQTSDQPQTFEEKEPEAGNSPEASAEESMAASAEASKKEDAPPEESAEDTAQVKSEKAEKAEKKEKAEKADTSSEEPSEREESKGIFGRKKKDRRDQQIEDLTDRCQRQMAEFDNFRKRSEKEKSAMFEMGEKTVLEKILPTVDNFERGLSGLDDEKKDDAFAQGMEKVYRQLTAALDSLGVKPIEAVGQPFDPNFHNAVQHVEDEEAGENIVVEEFQKGYMYRDSVLRHSMVKVAN